MIKQTKSSKILKKTLQIFIYIAVIYFIWNRVSSIEEIWGSIASVDLYFFIGAILLFIIQTLFNAFLWFYLMKSSGEKVVLSEQIDVYLSSYLLRYIPGNVVGILSRGEFNRRNGVPRLKSLWGWFFENITYLLVAISIGSYFVFKNLSDVTGLAQSHTSRSDIVTIGALVILILLVASSLLLMYKSNWLWNFFNEKVVRKLLRKNLGKNVSVQLNNRSRVLIIVGYVGSWLLYSLSFICLVYSVVPTAINYSLAISSLNALAWSIGYLFIVTPSGTGVREAVLIALLPVIAVVSPANATVIALGMRLVNILGEVGAFLVHKGYNHYIKVTKRLD